MFPRKEVTDLINALKNKRLAAKCCNVAPS
jgi:ERCC4-type nuclease